MKCPKCGTNNKDGALYCSECGDPLQNPSVSEEETRNVKDPYHDFNSWDPNHYKHPSPNTHKPSSKNPLPLIAGIMGSLAAIAVAAYVVFFIIQPGGPNSSSQPLDPSETGESVTFATPEPTTEILPTNTPTPKPTIEIVPADTPAVVEIYEEEEVPAVSFDESEGETAEQTIKVLGIDPMITLEGLTQASVVAANASSTIQQENTDNGPMCLFDGRDDTSWQEGVSGYGLGEFVDFSLDRIYRVKYMAFKLGNWKNDKYYFGNAMPRTISLTLGNVTDQITFTSERGMQWIEFSPEIDADSMRLVIDEVYPGSDWEDTCITEIEIYGR